MLASARKERSLDKAAAMFIHSEKTFQKLALVIAKKMVQINLYLFTNTITRSERPELLHQVQLLLPYEQCTEPLLPMLRLQSRGRYVLLLGLPPLDESRRMNIRQSLEVEAHVVGEAVNTCLCVFTHQFGK